MRFNNSYVIGGGVLFTKASLKKIHDKIVSGGCVFDKFIRKIKYGDIAIGKVFLL